MKESALETEVGFKGNTAHSSWNGEQIIRRDT